MSRTIRLIVVITAFNLNAHLLICVAAPPLSPQSALSLERERGSLRKIGRDAGFGWIPQTHEIIYSGRDAPTENERIYCIDVFRGIQREIGEGERPVPSPDGTRIAYLQKSEARSSSSEEWQLWLRDISGSPGIQLSYVPGGIVGGGGALFHFVDYKWSPDSKHIAYSTMVIDYKNEPKLRATGSTAEIYPFGKDRGRISELHVIDVASKQEAPALQKKGMIWSFDWLGDGSLLFEHDDPSSTRGGFCELSRYNLTDRQEAVLVTGYRRAVGYNPVLDNARAAMAFKGGLGDEVDIPSRSDLAVCSLQGLKVSMMTQDAAVGDVSWMVDGKGLVYVDGTGSQRHLFATDLSGHRRIVVDGAGEIESPAFSTDGLYLAWKHTGPDGISAIECAEWRDGKVNARRQLVILSDPFKGLSVGVTYSTQWKSFDGTVVDGYVTLPPTYNKSLRYPLVVIIHGGPLRGLRVIDGEWPGGPYFEQLLSARGYVIFRPDYRGSTSLGFDKVIAARAKGASFRTDCDDILSGVVSLEHQGLVDSKRVFLLGHSWGSVEANWVLTHTNTFRAAISYEGLDLFLDWGGAWKAFSDSFQWYMGGSPLENPRAYGANAAMLNAAKLVTPTLFVNAEYGVNSAALLWLSVASRSRGIDSEYVCYRNDGHVVALPENQKDLLQRILLWIQTHDVAVR